MPKKANVLPARPFLREIYVEFAFQLNLCISIGRHNVNYVLWNNAANRGKCATAQRNYTLPCLNKEFRGGGSKTVAPVFI